MAEEKELTMKEALDKLKELYKKEDTKRKIIKSVVIGGGALLLLTLICKGKKAAPEVTKIVMNGSDLELYKKGLSAFMDNGTYVATIAAPNYQEFLTLVNEACSFFVECNGD